MSTFMCLSGAESKEAKVSSIRICQLKPMEPEHQVIHLSPGSNIIGRNKSTGIRDTKCSKQQVELKVDSIAAVVKLKVLGINPCGVNGLMTFQHKECDLQHGDVLEMVYGRHPFEVIFKPPPELQIPINDGRAEECFVSGNNEISLGDKWESVQNGKMMIYTSRGVTASHKIASYDIDGTIIKTKSGNVFPKTCDDWMINYPEIPRKLKTLQNEGFKICLFTNQGGIAKGKTDLNEFKQKIKEIVKKLDVPVQVYIAITDGYYRKPLPGMWEHLEKYENNNLQISKHQSFFVGDAAGRPEIGKGKTKRRKDHSLADRLFAHNIGLKFYTPEEHFLCSKQENWIRLDFNPNIDFENPNLLDPISTKLPGDQCEMILMVGLPGSGKSHFSQHHLLPLGYTIANADTLGSTQACVTTCENSLLSRKSCVVDNTNVDVESRKKFIKLARKHNVPCRCFVMNVSVAQVKHNIAFRQLTNPKHSKINEMLLNMMKKKYTQPSLDEGFAELVKVNIIPNFECDEWKRLYMMYLVDK